MGADGLEGFHLWKNSEEIIQKYRRFVYPRLGEKSTSYSKIENGTFVDAPLLDISSTFIRKAVKDGKDLSYFVPENVWPYLHRHGLYI
jgi:nicotinate-nucleotide adenylyltransferase